MKSITIHNLDSSLDSLLREKAKKNGTSLNKTIQTLLRKSLGLSPDVDSNHREEFMDLFGIWSKQDENEFLSKTKDFTVVDPRDWE
jgi:hypothetical protein